MSPRRPTLGKAAGLALLLFGTTLTACSGGGSPATATAPSPVLQSGGITGGISTAQAGPTVRYVNAAIAPISTVAGSSNVSYTFTLKNCDGTNDGTNNCTGGTTTGSQQMGSASVVVPAGFNVTSVSFVSGSAGDFWSATLGSGTITLQSGDAQHAAGTNKLAVGESATFRVVATAPCVQPNPNTWTTTAYNDTPLPVPLPSTSPYVYVGSEPSVSINGSCVTVCTFSQGHWKNTSTWPVGSLMLGTVSYTQSELLSILGQPVAGNGLVSLAHQLIAAKLNLANGSDPSVIAITVAAADALIGGLVVPPVGSGSLNPGDTGALTTALGNYNTGVTGPGHCSSE